MITYLKGDATLPTGDGKKLIIHVCNNAGAWGAGFVMAISARFGDGPKKEYHAAWGKWASSTRLELGNIQQVNVSGDKEDTYVINMIAQVYYDDSGIPPIRYNALEECLRKVNDIAVAGKFSVHGPRFGCGLAGGSWSEIEKLINKCLPNVPVYIYDYVGEDSIPWKS
jgi:O-acetyl-ADP-ribose deacetylase (regulator of RNase III)